MAIRKAQAKISKKKNNNQAPCNKHSSQLLQKKSTIYKFKKDNEYIATSSKSKLCNSQPTDNSTVIILSFYGNKLKI